MSLEITSVTEDSDIPHNAGSYCLLSPGNSLPSIVFSLDRKLTHTKVYKYNAMTFYDLYCNSLFQNTGTIIMLHSDLWETF